jgi:hypothetical protein
MVRTLLVRKWILVKWASGLWKARRMDMSHRTTEDQAETMVTMLDAGWTLAAIAAHFGVGVKEVEQASCPALRGDVRC